MKNKKVKTSVKTRDPFAAQKGQRKFGSGVHKDKRKEQSKTACRGREPLVW